MSLDYQAIKKAYPLACTFDDTAGVHDKDGNKLSIDQTNVDAARVTLDAEAATVAYKTQRTGEDGTTDTIYASVGDQLDMQYKDAVNGTTTWKDHVAAVKAKYPKPE